MANTTHTAITELFSARIWGRPAILQTVQYSTVQYSTVQYSSAPGCGADLQYYKHTGHMLQINRAGYESSRRFHNHGECPYQGLLIVERAY